MKLTIPDSIECGGYNLSIEFRNLYSDQICTTKEVSGFSAGETLQWTSLSDFDTGCRDFEISPITVVYTKTTSGNYYCMKRLTFWDQDYKKYVANINPSLWYGKNTNGNAYRVKHLLPPSKPIIFLIASLEHCSFSGQRIRNKSIHMNIQPKCTRNIDLKDRRNGK